MLVIVLFVIFIACYGANMAYMGYRYGSMPDRRRSRLNQVIWQCLIVTMGYVAFGGIGSIFIVLRHDIGAGVVSMAMIVIILAVVTWYQADFDANWAKNDLKAG
ncbi:hypothetical protein BH11PAT2_BH11PAT2_00080 [soil metagenome]